MAQDMTYRTKVGKAMGFIQIGVPGKKFHKLGEYRLTLWFGGEDADRMVNKLGLWTETVAAANPGKALTLPYKQQNWMDDPRLPGVVLKFSRKFAFHKNPDTKRPLIVKLGGNALLMDNEGRLAEKLDVGEGTEIIVRFRKYDWTHQKKAGFSLEMVECDIQNLVKFIPKQPKQCDTGVFSAQGDIEDSDF